MKTLTKEMWQLLRQNLVSIFVFEFLYRGMILPMYMRLANRMLRWTLSLAGYSYLTAENFTRFLIRPWVLPALLAIGLLGGLLILLEAFALITAFQGSACQQRLSPFSIFWHGLQKAAEEISRGNWRLGMVILVHYLLVNLLLIARCLSHIRPLNFVIQEVFSSSRLSSVLLLLLAGCVAVALPTAYVGFLCVAGQEEFSSSLCRSRQMVRGRAVFTAGALMLGNITVSAVVVVIYLLSVTAMCMMLFTGHSLTLARLLVIREQIERSILFFGGIVLIVFHFAFLGAMYYQYGEQRSNYGGAITRSRKDFMVRIKALAMGVMLLASGFAYGVDLFYHGFTLPDEIFANTQITAHRGSSKTAPENTMAAIKAAVEEMADWVEMDVQMTRDQILVLAHDATLKRVAGINQPVSSFTWEELQLLEVGSWFSPEFAGERIPLLEDALEYCRGRINLNIEIKNVGRDSRMPEKVVKMILDGGMAEQCVITSTSLDYLKQVKQQAPQVRTGYILSAAYGDFYSLEAIDFISIRASFVNRRLVEQAHAQGKAVHAWTVNSKGEMERLYRMGVDNMITDYPLLAREMIYREEATETLLEYLKMIFQ